MAKCSMPVHQQQAHSPPSPLVSCNPPRPPFVELWKQVSKYVTGFVGCYVVFAFTRPHGHAPEVEYPYNNIRTKPFPWKDGDHGLVR